MTYSKNKQPLSHNFLNSFLLIFCAPHLLVSLTSQDLFRFRCVKYLSACVNLRRFLKQSFESLLGIMLACVEMVLMIVR